MTSVALKILYLADEREGAIVAADALRAAAANVRLTWARTPDSALHWVQGNRDAAAVIVEADAQGQSCASFVEQLRGLGLTTPVVVVAAAQLEQALPPLIAGADGYVLAGPSIHADLPRFVAVAIDRERARRADLAGKLAELGAARDSALERLERAEEARRLTEQRSATVVAEAAARLADAQARRSASLAREARICRALQQRLLELESARRNADERRACDAVAFADQLAKRHAEFTASLADTVKSRDALASQLSAATAARDEAQLASRAHAAAAAEHFRRREEELGAALAEATTARRTLEGALAEAHAAQRDARQRAELDLAAANERQAALEDLLAQEADRRTRLDQELASAEAARQETNDRYATELSIAAGRLADEQARYEAALEESAAARAGLEQRLAASAIELEQLARQRTSEASAAAEHLARREAEFGAQLAEVTAARDTLERALTEEQSARQRASDRAAADLASAAERQSSLEGLLAQHEDRVRSLEQQLAAAETARHDADHRHAGELAAAATDLDALRARYDAAATEHADARTAFEQQLIDAVAARQQADQRAAAAVAAANAREAEAVERLTTESAARAALERDLAGIRMESARGRQRSLHVVSAARRRAREQKARMEAQLGGERTDAASRLSAKDEEIRQIHEERERLRHLLGTTQEQVRRLHSTADEERQANERARLTSESEVQRIAAEYGQLRQAFDQLQAAFQALEQVAGEHAAERARLGSVVAERDAQLSAQAERHALAEQHAHDASEQLQKRLRETLETSGSDIARLQGELEGLRRELDAARTGAEALRDVAVRVPDLQAQLELSEKERRRQFERAPYGLCRCTEAGVITEANHAFAMLLGRRRADQLRNMDFAAAVFDRAGDVGWLLERTRTMRKAEPVETSWKTQDGRHLIVRLQALATTTGSVEIVVEDITGFRALEDRLRQAQRMEAVGRLASEVAVTCDALLRDVARDTHEWLAAIASDDALRRRGEMLLADLARAAGFLRQLGAYGDRQVRALEPVSVQRVLRDLAPVLKGVAGDSIELVLPKASGSFDVDVEAERLERVLVNVASYARERMPQGGQIRIDLATTTVGRRFTARYPNIRPGPHVLITVTELPAAGGLHGGTERRSRSAYKPGVDLGALVDLIGACGGHLWMEAQPAGNMMVKIHLPKPANAGATDPVEPGERAAGRGRLARWFRPSPAAVVRS